MAHAHDPSTQQIKAGGSKVEGQPQLLNELEAMWTV